MSPVTWLVLCVLLTASTGTMNNDFRRASVVISTTGRPTIKKDVLDRKAVAFGYFNDTFLSTGWSVLEIHTGEAADDKAMFCAGYLEGFLTAHYVKEHVDNLKKFWINDMGQENWKKSQSFMAKQDAWIRQFANGSNDRIAMAVWRITQQLDGLLAGVQAVLGPTAVTKMDILILQNSGDLIDISRVVDKKMHNPEHLFLFLDSLNPRERRQYLSLSGMCSALIVFTPGLENLYMSHVTWFTYSASMRIFKHYNFPLKNNPWPSPKVSFSSYPGFLISVDDFYMLGSRMVMLQTTNNIFNTSLYAQVTPQTLPAWYRVRAANHLATSGDDWATVVSKHNSGTYNNQYMVVDLKRIKLQSHVAPGTLTIVEQIPGLVEWSDQTAILVDGHWPSYNVPFQAKIYNMSGYPEVAKRYGPENSYQMSARAKLFRRDAGLVRSLEDMKVLMRSNNYKTDPYSDDDPTQAICARGDLLNRTMGCYDGKVTDFARAMRFEAEAINGPTTNNGSLKPFSWNKAPFSEKPHEGLPTVYNYKWEKMRPLL